MKKAVHFPLQSNMRCYLVVRTEHTCRFLKQSLDIAAPRVRRPPFLPVADTISFIEVAKIFSHWHRGKEYQWLALSRGAPQHEAQSQKTGECNDGDGTTTEAFYDYVERNKILFYFH